MGAPVGAGLGTLYGLTKGLDRSVKDALVRQEENKEVDQDDLAVAYLDKYSALHTNFSPGLLANAAAVSAAGGVAGGLSAKSKRRRAIVEGATEGAKGYAKGLMTGTTLGTLAMAVESARRTKGLTRGEESMKMVSQALKKSSPRIQQLASLGAVAGGIHGIYNATRRAKERQEY